jgi:hypothetical protein
MKEAEEKMKRKLAERTKQLKAATGLSTEEPPRRMEDRLSR